MLDPAHLWFLGNIFVYVIILSPVFFYLKRNEEGRIVGWIKKWLSNPFGLLLVIAAFIVEVLLVDPYLYELYAMTWHGFFLGLLAFFFGFCFVLSGSSFWNMLLKWTMAVFGCCRFIIYLSFVTISNESAEYPVGHRVKFLDLFSFCIWLQIFKQLRQSITLFKPGRLPDLYHSYDIFVPGILADIPIGYRCSPEIHFSFGLYSYRMFRLL